MSGVRSATPKVVHILEGTTAEGRKWTGCGRLISRDAVTVGRARLDGREHEVTCLACRSRYSIEPKEATRGV